MASASADIAGANGRSTWTQPAKFAAQFFFKPFAMTDATGIACTACSAQVRLLLQLRALGSGVAAANIGLAAAMLAFFAWRAARLLLVA